LVCGHAQIMAQRTCGVHPPSNSLKYPLPLLPPARRTQKARAKDGQT
jgi:hypothetical protein